MSLLQISEPGESPEPHQRRLAVGIDLGTTHSLVAAARHGAVDVGERISRVVAAMFLDRVRVVAGLEQLRVGAIHEQDWAAAKALVGR